MILIYILYYFQYKTNFELEVGKGSRYLSYITKNIVNKYD